jgi:hypothetical protein
MKRIKVRFNLGRGKNFMKWKIQYPNGVVEYYSPNEVQLIMKGCQLRNHTKVAEKIYNGGEKVVCAWVLCDDITIIDHTFMRVDMICDKIKYNPRVQPNWLLNGEVVDKAFITTIASVDNGLYKIK